MHASSLAQTQREDTHERMEEPAKMQRSNLRACAFFGDDRKGSEEAEPQTLSEKARDFWRPPSAGSLGCLLRAEWLPDGSGFLCAFDSGKVLNYATPQLPCREEAEAASENPTKETLASPLLPWLEVDAGGEWILDVALHPQFHWQTPETCVFAVASKERPVSLFSLFNDGKQIASLHTGGCTGEEFSESHTVCFQGPRKLLSGGRSVLRLFDFQRGDSLVQEWRLGTRRSSGTLAQKGVLSSVASGFGGGGDASVVACGGYSGSLWIYDLRSSKASMQAKDPQSAAMGAVTQLKFRGATLFSAHRQDPFLRCWDLRAVHEPLYRVERQNRLSQRLFFDLHSDLLVAGSQDGSVLLCNANDGELKRRLGPFGLDGLASAHLLSVDEGGKASSAFCPVVSAALSPGDSALLLTGQALRVYQEALLSEEKSGASAAAEKAVFSGCSSVRSLEDLFEERVFSALGVWALSAEADEGGG